MRASNLFWASLFLSLFLFSSFSQERFANGQSADGQKALARFQKDLAKRVVKDQGVRYALIDFNKNAAKPGAEPRDEKEYFRLAKRASDVDENNLKWLKKQIAKWGFPEPSQIGTRSAEEFYLLILHADRDRDFQKDCIRRMRESQEWSEEPVWSSKLKWLAMRASGPSSRELFRVEDPKKKRKAEELEPDPIEVEAVNEEPIEVEPVDRE